MDNKNGTGSWRGNDDKEEEEVIAQAIGKTETPHFASDATMFSAQDVLRVMKRQGSIPKEKYKQYVQEISTSADKKE